MPNTYFQFKQFTVQQEHTAMKVCTDACLFGAWVAQHLAHITTEATRILDIGTGTGLLSLMVAQKTQAAIDAVEIDTAAALQAAANFRESSWKERLMVHQTAIQEFSNTRPYNFILSNPPFFENDLKSIDSKRNLALHSEALSLEELLQAIQSRLTSNGQFAILLPYHRSSYFESLCSTKGFYTAENTSVRQTPTHAPFRSMLLFTTTETTTIHQEIIIKEQNHYTPSFTALLKDYYLFI